MRPQVILSALSILVSVQAAPLLGQAVERDQLRLGPGDRVRVEIAGDSTLSGDFDIDSEGAVLVPILGLVAVGTVGTAIFRTVWIARALRASE